MSKRHNGIDKNTFLTVLANQRRGDGFNWGFRVRYSPVMTYVQERAAVTYFYGKRKLLADGLRTAPLEVQRTRPPDDHSFTHMDPRMKHPFMCIVAGPTGCSKATFVTRLLRNASSMIDPSPERITWYYVEWQSAYENPNVPNLHLEEGLPISFDASKRNIVVLKNRRSHGRNRRARDELLHDKKPPL